jgi:hypothetical protein
MFNGSDPKAIMPLIKNTTVISVHEVTTTAEVAKKLEEIKKTVSKPTSGSYLIIVFK